LREVFDKTVDCARSYPTDKKYGEILDERSNQVIREHDVYKCDKPNILNFCIKGAGRVAGEEAEWQERDLGFRWEYIFNKWCEKQNKKGHEFGSPEWKTEFLKFLRRRIRLHMLIVFLNCFS